jgi:hypothetical protein
MNKINSKGCEIRHLKAVECSNYTGRKCHRQIESIPYLRINQPAVHKANVEKIKNCTFRSKLKIMDAEIQAKNLSTSSARYG